MTENDLFVLIRRTSTRMHFGKQGSRDLKFHSVDLFQGFPEKVKDVPTLFGVSDLERCVKSLLMEDGQSIYRFGALFFNSC